MFIELKKNWKNFLISFSQPQIILVVGLIIFLGYFSIKIENPLITSLLTIVIAFLSGYCGTCIDSEIRKLEGNTLLITQGKGAIRNLKLLHSDLQEISTQLLDYKKQVIDKKTINYEVLEVWINETIQKITMVKKQGINAIEYWSNWIPEANITTQVETIDDLQNKISILEEAVKHSNSESEKEQKERIRLISELSKAQEELQQKDLQLQRSIYGINNSDRPTFTTESFNYLSMLANSDSSSSNLQNKLGLSSLSSLSNPGDNVKG